MTIAELIEQFLQELADSNLHHTDIEEITNAFA